MDGSKFDDLLTKLGTGKWNMIYFIFCGYWFFLLPPHVFNAVYLAPQLNFTCRPPQMENITISEDSCTYLVNTSASEALQEEPCIEWDFDTSIYSSTLTSEFGLVCSKAYLRATFQSMYTFGIMFSSLISGYVADRYGRKIVVVVSQTMFSITCIGISLLTNFKSILVFRLILGALASPTLFMLVMEVCEIRMRSLVGIVLGLPWALGIMAWGAIAYFVRDWRWLQRTVSLPTLLVFPFLYFIDESPRWLVVRGHHDQAIRVLQRAARLNKVSLPPKEELQLMMKDIQKESVVVKESKTWVKDVPQEKNSCWSFRLPRVLSTRKMRLIIGMICVNFFITYLVYSGLILSGSTYSEDPFLYIIISGLMEVPASTVTVPIINRWGRKYPSIIGYFIAGATVTSLAFIPSDISWLVMTLAMLGKLAITSSNLILYVYEAELLPTEVRLQGIAITVVVGQVAAAIAPYITDFLSPLVPWLSSVLFGLSSIVAGLSLVPLPETLNTNLPDTISDLGALWKKNKKKKMKKNVADVDEGGLDA